MNSANADESIISIIEETEFGTTPVDPVWQEGRSLGDGLVPAITKTTSNELSPNADVTGVFPTTGGASGDLNFELASGTFFDLIFEHSLRGNFDGFGILEAGTEHKSLSIEKQILVGGVPFYKRYPGCRVESLSLELNRDSDSALTGTVSFMCNGEFVSETIVQNATYKEAELTQAFYMPEVRKLRITGDGITGDYCFRQYGFTINNNIRQQQGTCTATTVYPDLFAKGSAYGKREVTTDLVAYFRDLELADIFRANTSFELSYILSNGVQAYKITFPAVYLMTDETPIEGTNSDVVENMTGQAILDQESGCSIFIEKILSLVDGAGFKLNDTTVLPDTLTPAVAGTYYDTGISNDTKTVYIRADETKAVWWSTADAVWYVTPIADIGTSPTNNSFSNNQAASPIGGTWIQVGASGDGSVESIVYDPEA